ncbi:caspase-3-like [Periophthalmus magnuspinnatus]|uniref:caspase-3-like n=1 Tax=Periophthalmus magnuspinnatus TaxID=409849 RepID=UPI00243701C0|nr:caspase-3-like [Periophthalmus magnuspinnatus]
MAGKQQDTVDAAMFAPDKEQSSRNTVNSFTIVIKVKADKEHSSGFTVDSAKIMDEKRQRNGNENESAKIIKSHEEPSSGDTVDASKLPEVIKAPEEPSSSSSNTADAEKLPVEKTSPSVRAVPTIKDLEGQCKYRMDFPCLGVCLIINNKNFKEGAPMPKCLTGNGLLSTRSGTDVDEGALKKTFETLGYKVIVHKDLTKKQMKQELEKVSNEDHSNNASFVCFILSHGNEEGINGTDDTVKLEKLTKYFKGDECKTLIGKPKLFFLQVCRGENLDSGTAMDRDLVDATALPITPKIPVEADFLYAYATAPGYYAWRNAENGSWFIQSLCEILPKYKHLELMQIMTRVNRKVALDFVSSNSKKEFDGKKAIPCFTSMLTKDFYLPE